MHNKKKISVAVAAALGFTSGLPLVALAQDSGGKKVALEEVVVTGSRIRKADFVSSSPVQTIGAEQIMLEGTINTERLLNQMPQVVAGLTNTSNNPGDGTASVDLRGLGSQRTLVLVNSKRIVPTGQDGTVDINNIPAALIERVEIVTGGASAVYGSDAVAGVVNFIMKENYEGFQVDTKYDITEENDGDQYDVSLTMGSNFADDRGNATAFFGFTHRDDVFAGDRDFSATSLGDSIGPDPYLYPFGSSGIPATRVFGTAIFDGVSNSQGARFLPDGSSVPYDGATDTYNFAPTNYLQLPQKRYTFNTFLNYKLNDDVTAYGDGLFVTHETPQQLAPTPAQLDNVVLNYAVNPFLSDQSKKMFLDSYDTDANGGIAGDGIAELPRLRRRLTENSNRTSDDELTTLSMRLGFKGEIQDNWNWDTYGSWGKVTRKNRLGGDAASSRLTAGLNTADGVTCIDPMNPDVTIPGCVASNIWGEGNMSQEAVDYINVGATNTTDYEQRYFGGTIAGDAMQLPAGPLGVAAGAEYRKENSKFTPDEFLSSGDVLGFNAGEPTAGEFDVTEVFAEVNVPLLSQVPGAFYLGANGAFRYSDYSTIGSVNSYAYGLEWRPIESVLVRGQFQRAVRAPNIFELYAGSYNNFPSYSDPCAGGVTGALRDFCIQEGVPASVIDSFEAADSQVESTQGGNPDLSEEESDTYTAGIVWEPDYWNLDGLQVAVDYYKIKIDGAIDVAGGGPNNLIQLCYLGLDSNSEFCQAITRDTTGDIVNVNALNANISTFNTDGVDMQVTYTWDMDNLGLGGSGATFILSATGTHVIENSFVPSPGSETRNCEGRFGSPCGQTITGTATPDNKWYTSLTYSTGPLNVRLGWVWIDEVKDTRVDDGTPANELPQPTISSTNYWELSGLYAFNDNLSVVLGVDNLFDNDPPVYGDAAVQSNTDPSTYDVLGRRYWAGVTLKF